MSRNPSDSFLPSGAMASPPTFSPNSLISPASQIPRTVPDFSPHPHSNRSSPNQKPYLHSSRSPSAQGRPISPPKTRSASADNSSAALVEDWRAYTNKLRMQNEGERAHMVADRARMEEVIAEERALWDAERRILQDRILELEAELELAKRSPGGSFLSQKDRILNQPHHALGFTSPGSNAISVTGSIDGTSSRAVPQESGRNADGSPFYAPAPRNPSRTFEVNEVSALRVDTISAARETPIRVTSKELTSSDFGIHSPPTTATELETIPEGLPESIDISHILPGGDGIPIKASAVAPEFVAKVLSPQSYSPAKLSPNVKPPPRDIGETLGTNPRDTLSPRSRDSNGKLEKVDVGLVIAQPENKRLIMHAGHTPNHSISKLDFLTAESGSTTPTQVPAESQPHEHVATCSKFDGADEHLDEDRGLTGPLGITNDKEHDDLFLAKLVEKLAEEAKKSEGVSPSESNASYSSDMEEMQRARAQLDEEKDLPALKLKPSINFGRPMGSM